MLAEVTSLEGEAMDDLIAGPTAEEPVARGVEGQAVEALLEAHAADDLQSLEVHHHHLVLAVPAMQDSGEGAAGVDGDVDGKIAQRELAPHGAQGPLVGEQHGAVGPQSGQVARFASGQGAREDQAEAQAKPQPGGQRRAGFWFQRPGLWQGIGAGTSDKRATRTLARQGRRAVLPVAACRATSIFCSEFSP